MKDFTNLFPRVFIIKDQGKIEDIDYLIIASPVYAHALNGYLIYENDIQMDLIHGCNIDVHGGVTYQENKEGYGHVIGFDTAHADSAIVPRNDPIWIKSELVKMKHDIGELLEK
jgi:hypothetical protein